MNSIEPQVLFLFSTICELIILVIINLLFIDNMGEQLIWFYGLWLTTRTITQISSNQVIE